jgi:putative cell wall-binding protein
LKLVTKVLPIAATLSLTFGVISPSASANNYSEINKILTEKALEHHIPPEVLKAIALQESSWDPSTSEDGGIGLMQVTDTEGFDESRLKTDLEYNIEAGIKILEEKWNWGLNATIPRINDANRDIIENWYFAIMAYNGVVPKNSPIIKADGSPNTDAYQEKVFDKIEDAHLQLELHDFTFKPSDFDYDTNQTDFDFNTLHFETNEVLTKSKYLFEKGDRGLTSHEVNFYSSSDSNKRIGTVSKGTLVEFLDGEYQLPNVTTNLQHYAKYKVRILDGSNRTGYITSYYVQPVTSRISGASRYHTAVQISKEGWKDGADTVIIARGDDFPDALAGAPLAYHYNAPILLVNSKDKNIHSVTKKEIKRLGAKNAFILGSTNAVPASISEELKKMGITIKKRFAGNGRFDTARQIAEYLPDTNKAILAYGYNFPDVLAIAPYAAKNGIPILLTDKGSMPSSTKGYLAHTSQTWVVGGEDIIPDELIANIKGKTRIAGNNRYATAREIITELNVGKAQAYVATGENFADALTGAVLAAKRNNPMILTTPQDLPWSMEKVISERNIKDFTMVGGKNVVGIEDELSDLAD